jgi:putative ABC transport system permease protein
MNAARIALRNLSRQKRRSFMLGGAIAFGILIITLITSLAAGFMVNVQENFASFLAGHIFVSGYEKSPSGRLMEVIRDDRELLDAVKNVSGIAGNAIARRSGLSGNLIFEGRSVMQSVTGVDWAYESKLAGRLVLRTGSMQAFLAAPNGLILNEKVAGRLRAQVGETLLVQLRTTAGQQNVGEFLLAGTTVDTGILSTISAYAHRGHVNALIDIAPDDYTQLCITAENLVAVDLAAERVYAALKDRLDILPRAGTMVSAEDYRRLQRRLTEETWVGTRYAMSTINDFLGSIKQIATVLNIISTVVLLILFAIIMVGILNTFRVIIYERTREIGTMRALGMQRGTVRGLFILEALFMSVAGVVAGLALYALIAGVLSAIRFPLDTPFAVFLAAGRLFFKVEPARLAAYLAGVAAITVLAAMVPAVRAARMEPARSLRKTY